MNVARDWQELAQLDSRWAILSETDKQSGRWDDDDFFRRGETDVAELMQHANALRKSIRRQRALDFGCGVGRITRALLPNFSECYGVDISPEMVRQASMLTPQAHFLVTLHSDLRVFPDSHFDFVYSVLVLQHQSSRGVILGYLREFVRVLAPGGLLVFQLPTQTSLKQRLGVRWRLYSLLRFGGFSSPFLYARGLYPIRMSSIAQKCVVAQLTYCGARVLAIAADVWAGKGNCSRTYWMTK